MRRDMNKVLIERPRAGGRGKQRKTYEKAIRPRVKDFLDCGIEDDQRPTKESSRKKHMVNGDPKQFTDLLGPLDSYLRAQDGRPWNDVWSEICAVMKGNGLQAQHIKGHIKQMVGGIPHSGETFFRDEDWHSDGGRYYSSVWVDEDGIVHKSKKRGWRNERKKEKFHYYRESDTVEYHKLNGAWFRVEITSYEVERRYRSYGDRYYTRKETAYSVVNKRALNKKEIKKLRLNDRTETIPPKLNLEEYQKRWE